MGLFDGDPSGADLDAAFAFIYPGNLGLLRAMGAELEFFAPIEGDPLPAVDAVWLPGGYPEIAPEVANGQQAAQRGRSPTRAADRTQVRQAARRG